MRCIEIVIDAVIKADDHIIVTAPVLIPDVPDCDYNRGEPPLSAKQVEELAHSFMNYQVIEKDHDYLTTHEKVGEAIESYILKEKTAIKQHNGEIKEYPKGTWIVSSKITDSASIKKVEDGTYSGFSVTTIPKNIAEDIKNNGESAMKSSAGKLIKDIPNPVAFAVSLVRKPCVSGAKFCELNNNNIGAKKMADNNDETSVLNQIKSILSGKSNEEEPEYATKEDFDNFKNEVVAAIRYGFKSMAEPHFKSSSKANKKEEDDENKNKEDNNSSSEGDNGNNNNSDDGNNSSNSSNNTNSSSEGNSNSCNNNCNKNEDDDENKKKAATKSKGVPIHSGNQPAAKKSDASVVYELMGRSSTGRRIHEKN